MTETKVKKQRKKNLVANKPDPDVFWMIRRKSDGFWSKGTPYPSFAITKGKVFATMGTLKAHLTTVTNLWKFWYSDDPEATQHPCRDAEIVQCRRVVEVCMDVLGYGE